jgi:hypothetical protein
MRSPRRKCTQNTRGGYSEDTEIRAPDNGGSARDYQRIFVPLAALTNSGHGPNGGQPTVYLYIAALEANVLNCRKSCVSRGAALIAQEVQRQSG